MIYFIRHGLDDEHFIGGWSELDLILEGKQQIIEQRDFLKKLKIDQIISSDIKRARTSAELIQRFLQKELHYTSLFRELNNGDLNGMKKSIAEEKYPEFFNNVDIYTPYPHGESLYSFYQRIQKLISELEKYENSLIVTHRGVINMIYYDFNHVVIDYDKERWGVTHASIHELDLQKRTIRKIK